MSTQSNRDKFLGTNSGQRLLQEHSLSETGTWQIHGEGPNCDMGGAHHQPYLTDAKGSLSDVIDYAVELNGFWGWGAGGSIKKRLAPVVVDVPKNKERAALRERKRRLEDELYNLNERMKKLGA